MFYHKAVITVWGADMVISLIWWLYVVDMYQNVTVYPVNMYNYVLVKIFLNSKKCWAIEWVSLMPSRNLEVKD
jgi:hypothetical protein